MKKFRNITVILLLIVDFLVISKLAFAANPMRFTAEENVVSIHDDQNVLLRYRYGSVPFKPYVQQLFSPRGVNVLRDAPADHLHHHALMFAVAVDGVNFWEEQQQPGRQTHKRFADVKINKRNEVHYAGFTEDLDWVNPSVQELLLKESRTVKVCRLNEPEVTLLSWQSEFELPPRKESVTLTGSHYFGLGMRFVKSMDTGGVFRNADGRTGDVVRGDERLVRANWCAYTAGVNGKPLTIAMFGHPDNLRHPTQWFTMTKPFAYLSATLNLHKEPLTVTQDKPLVLRYAVALWDGRVEKDQIDKLYRQWSTWSLDAAPIGSPGAAAKQPQATEESTERLAGLEEKIMAAAEKAKRSVVRFVQAKPYVNPAHPRWFSGVILSADGYVVTGPYNPGNPDHLPLGEAVSIHLADGRLVPGVAVGSSRELGFGLVKITPDGPWPNAETGSAAEVKQGDLCLAVVYPRANCYQEHYPDREPSLRIGLVGVKAERRWLGVSTQVGLGEDGGLFDLNGRLIGIHAKVGVIDLQPYTTIETVKQHWKGLVGRSALVKQQAAGRADGVAESPSKEVLLPVPAQDDPRIASVIDKARKVTVRYEPGGCSGVVVTSDGYVATCAHHDLPAGTDITINFSGGREVPGKIVGSDFLLDVGLAKITAPGPWPHAQWGSATPVSPGDLCVGLGFARWDKDSDSERKNWRKEPQVRVGRVRETHFAPAILEHSLTNMGGDSGGGLFDGEGRLIGVRLRAFGEYNWSVGIDLVKEHWDFLISGGVSLGDSAPFGLSPTAEAFRKAVEPLLPIVVEVLGDRKRRALGTIVSTDGYILTKASELYGSISCRLADGRKLPAVTVGVSRRHDLALLKIDAAGLPQIRWRRERLGVGSFVGAMRYGEPPAVSVMALATHSVPGAPGYLVGGKVKEVKDGVEVEELWLGSPLRKGDVIGHVEGCPTPNLKAFEQVTKRHPSGRAWGLPSVIPGDPIRVGVRRDGKDLELRFPLLAVVSISGYDSASPRSCAFPAVFDTDAIITRDTCGGPVVDRFGEVVGITIALATKERVYIIPAAVARKVFDQLRQ